MKATDQLRQEHGLIEKVLGILEILAIKAERGGDAETRQLLKAAAFFREFADARHHEKEERILFPALSRRGFPMEMGPVRVMLQEHELGRELLRETEAAANRFLAGDTGASLEASRNALSFSAHLRQHIFKENNILFPMADQSLTGTDQAEIEAAFSLADREDGGANPAQEWLEAVRILSLPSIPVA